MIQQQQVTQATSPPRVNAASLNPLQMLMGTTTPTQIGPNANPAAAAVAAAAAAAQSKAPSSAAQLSLQLLLVMQQNFLQQSPHQMLAASLGQQPPQQPVAGLMGSPFGPFAGGFGPAQQNPLMAAAAAAAMAQATQNGTPAQGNGNNSQNPGNLLLDSAKSFSIDSNNNQTRRDFPNQGKQKRLFGGPGDRLPVSAFSPNSTSDLVQQQLSSAIIANTTTPSIASSTASTTTSATPNIVKHHHGGSNGGACSCNSNS